MAKKTSKPDHLKTIVQLRYKPQIGFLTALVPTAQRFKEYSDWQSTGVAFSLRDTENHCSLNLAADAVSYDDDSANEKIEADRLKHVVEVIPGGLSIESFTRLGYRRKYVLPVDMTFESLLKVMNLKLFSQAYALRKLLPPRWTDLMYRVDAGREKYLCHITVGPVRGSEMERWAEFSRHHLKGAPSDDVYKEKILPRYPEVGVFFDLDYYQETSPIEVSELEPFIETARHEVDGLARNLSAYLLDDQIESDSDVVDVENGAELET